MTMKPHTSIKCSLALASLLLTLHGTAAAATPEQEKSFVERYRKAVETKDTAALESFLHTKGADAETIEFFKMIQGAIAETRPASITLATLSAEDTARFDKPMEMPGGNYKLAVKPVRLLVIVNEEKNGDGSSTSTSTVPVAEVDGKLVIPLPVPVKAR